MKNFQNATIRAVMAKTGLTRCQVIENHRKSLKMNVRYPRHIEVIVEHSHSPFRHLVTLWVFGPGIEPGTRLRGYSGIETLELEDVGYGPRICTKNPMSLGYKLARGLKHLAPAQQAAIRDWFNTEVATRLATTDIPKQDPLDRERIKLHLPMTVGTVKLSHASQRNVEGLPVIDVFELRFTDDPTWPEKLLVWGDDGEVVSGEEGSESFTIPAWVALQSELRAMAQTVRTKGSVEPLTFDVAAAI